MTVLCRWMFSWRLTSFRIHHCHMWLPRAGPPCGSLPLYLRMHAEGQHLRLQGDVGIRALVLHIRSTWEVLSPESPLSLVQKVHPLPHCSPEKIPSSCSGTFCSNSCKGQRSPQVFATESRGWLDCLFFFSDIYLCVWRGVVCMGDGKDVS